MVKWLETGLVIQLAISTRYGKNQLMVVLLVSPTYSTLHFVQDRQ